MAAHHIVVLDNICPPPEVNFAHQLTQYDTTSPEQLPARLKDATIAITSMTRMTREGIQAAPHLTLIATNGTGTNNVDKIAARERSITVCRVPAQNTDAVSEHAFALYYALRRKIIPMHNLTMGGVTWSQGPAFKKLLGDPPRTNSEETLVVMGYGAIGQRMQAIGTALGMRVLVAERKDSDTVREGRVSFSQAIGEGTIFMAAAPLDDTTRHMLGTSEFEAMDPTALLINVGRSGIVDGKALVAALQGGQIGGAATDVFEIEPATRENCILLDPSIPNLVLSPHIAWHSSKTFIGTNAVSKANLEAFVAGSPINVVD
ncbi:hypothetical protein LTR81_004118 [Elasticomyces elasticus]